MHLINMLTLILLSAFIQFTSSEVLENPMEVPGLYEGDIRITPLTKGLLSTYIKKWPNGIVYYTINTNSYTQAQLNTIYSGMKLIENQLGQLNGINYITFTPRTTQSNYIEIQSLDGCWSYVGMVGGNQTLSLQAGGCTYVGTVAHELIHALGFFHEQSRADRDNYITVNYGNIRTGYSRQFDKVTSNYDYQGLGYDILSIMHYGAYAFSSNGQPTIEAKQAGITLYDAYQKTAISAQDVEELKIAYKPIVQSCSSSPCLNGGTCAQTNSGVGYVCICLPLYAGLNCENTLGNACSSSPCLNGGICSQTNSGLGYSCQCPSSYSGTNCQIFIITTTTIQPSNCVNAASDGICEYYSNNFDYCNKFTAYLGQLPFRDACKKTCKLCSGVLTTVSTCVDTQTNCAFLANYCYLLVNVNPHPCARTCNACSGLTTTTKAPCVDAQKSACQFWINYCYLLTNLNPHPCAKTCSIC